MFAGTACGAIPGPPNLHFAPYARVSDYFQKLAKASVRVKLLDAGLSSNGRPMFVAAIGDPVDLRRPLEGVRRVWNEFGAGREQEGAELAFQLLSAPQPRGVVNLVAPCSNPDGTDLLANWHRQNLNSVYQDAPLPRAAQRYAGSDVAADTYMMNLQETRNLAPFHYGQEPARVEYVVPTRGQWDLPTAFDLLQRFASNGAQVLRRASDGAFVVRGAERTAYMVDELRLPKQMDVLLEKTQGMHEDEALTPVSAAELRPGARLPLDVRENNSYSGMASLFDRMERVWWTRDGQIASDPTPPSSSESSWRLHGERPTWELHRPRVAVYEPWMDHPDTGWTEWVLDTYKLPYTAIHNEDFAKDDLDERFETIVLGAQPASQIMHGDRKWKQRPEYAGGIGLDGTAHLEHFVKRGGTLITLGESSLLAVDQFGLPVSRSAMEPGLVQLRNDATIPVAFGMPAECWGIATDGLAWEDVGDAAVPVRYEAGKAAVVVLRWGTGKVVLFGIRPQYRGQTFGTFKLLLNAIMTGAAHEIR